MIIIGIALDNDREMIKQQKQKHTNRKRRRNRILNRKEAPPLLAERKKRARLQDEMNDEGIRPRMWKE
jgi:hypothetical protein